MRLQAHHIVAVEQPVQLLTCQCDDIAFHLAGPLEPRPFQTLLPQAEAVAFPVQDLILSRLRLQNTNSRSENGSCCSASSTSTASPLMPLRKSIISRHRYTTGSSFDGRIIPGLPPYSAPPSTPQHPRYRKMPPTHRSVTECTTRCRQADLPPAPAETGSGAYAAVRLS